MMSLVELRPLVKMEDVMAWKTPKVVEITLGAEINSYACADLKK
jgi:coenzyme PQQ precursor peptide PqqA